MPRYSEKQKAALDTMMRDDVYLQAMRIIDGEGLAGLTLERLAKAVGVSRATLYNYFTDRDAILDYLDDRTFTPVLETIDGIADGDLSPDEKLVAIVTEVFDRVHENTALVVALSPGKFRDGHCACHADRHRRGMEALQRVVQEGIALGVFRDLQSELTGRVILGAVTGFIDSMTYSGEFHTADEIVPTFMEVILGGLKR